MHAGCVAMEGRGLLILGPSGSGKSALALQLMVLGAGLVSDDHTDVTREAGGLTARCPAALAGMIEARGLGILHAPVVSSARLVLAVDLGVSETERLPPFRHVDVLGLELPLVRAQQGSHFHAALLHYLRFGRHS
nr:HPr kinase/phosphatase C-terminal domain-containing protein [Fertoeibacter niger]